jgi:dsDNA-specific endonuclease/ATPase MutS2
LIQLDFALAKWDWCIAEKAERPKVRSVPQVVLRRAYHPVLRRQLKQLKKEAIPLSMVLSDQRIMVVSGPMQGVNRWC